MREDPIHQRRPFEGSSQNLAVSRSDFGRNVRKLPKCEGYVHILAVNLQWHDSFFLLGGAFPFVRYYLLNCNVYCAKKWEASQSFRVQIKVTLMIGTKEEIKS